MSRLANQKPALLWKHFEALSAIPRVSSNETAAGDYVVTQAKLLGLEWLRDGAGNVLVKKPARPGCEKLAHVILQSHLDMVGDKREGSPHDFSKDPIKLIVEDGWLHADGTTLGADNGIGVSASLAILESTDLPHGPLSALFTVEEEIGLLGAAKVPKDFLQGDALINIDGDTPFELTIGCAGAMDLRIDFPVEREPLQLGWSSHNLTLGGLQGGHSGGDIHRGRGNALRLLARLLDEAGAHLSWRLVSFAGGAARNAIPRDAQAVFVLRDDHFAQYKTQLETSFQRIKNELAIADPQVALSLTQAAVPSAPLNQTSTLRLITFLRACPLGVIRNSDLHANVVETSGNLGIFNLHPSGLNAQAQLLLRSLVDSAKQDLGESISLLARLAGGLPVVHGDYPGWAPDRQSKLAPLFARITQEVTGKTPQIAVIHAGLECGILRALNPRLDCISCGSLIEGMHSPKERVNLQSVEQVFEIVCRSLTQIRGV
jgi:dipeptidase D